MIKRFILLFLLSILILNQKIFAVNIVLDGTKTLISGTDCSTAKYRFGTTSSFNGENLDIILDVIAEDNDYIGGACVDTQDGVISFHIRDRDYYNNVASMDLKFTVVKHNTDTPIDVDTLTVTNFDLDSNPDYTASDDIYYKNPLQTLISQDSEVLKQSGSFYSSYSVKLRGKIDGNCNDSATLTELSCRAGAIWKNTSQIYARVQNDNAYGTLNLNSYPTAHRLIQFSFEYDDIAPLISDNNETKDCGVYNYSINGSKWTESSTHSTYNNNLIIQRTISIPDASKLKISFSGESEHNYDFLYIIDENGVEHKYSGNFNNMGDLIVDGSSVTLKFTSDGSITKSGITVTIDSVECNDNPTVAIEKSLSIEEGDIGDKNLTFNIILDRPASNRGVTVQVQPHNITANEGEDYNRNSSLISFNQGEISKSISYTIHGDYKVEDNETFSIELHNPQNAILDSNRSEAIGTIINDDNKDGCNETLLSLDIPINSTNDDAEERASNGHIYINSSDLEMTQEHHKQIVGIRFQNINIPKNATITNAYIQFNVDEKSSQTTNLNIYGEATDNANSFSSSHYNISSRVKTISSIAWSPPAWNIIHQEGVNQRTPNLKDIVQEIVNRDGWSSGNSISFIITGTGKRVAEAYDGESDKAPRLHIEYMGCQSNNNTTATCYALTDNSDRLYKVTMNPNGDPLPTASTISISTIFNGEGSAYRASNNKFYAFTATSDDSGPSDLYTIDVDTGTTKKIVDNIISGTVDGAEFYFNPTLNKEILYIISGENNSKLYAFDPDSWSLLEGYPKNTNTDLSSLAINPINGVAYAIDDYNYDHKKPKVYRLNLETGVTTHITTLQHLADAEGLAFASDGNLYIEDEGRDDLNGKKLYMVNLQTGELTPSAITNSNGDIEGLSCNGTQIAIDNPIVTLDGNSSVVEGDTNTTDLIFSISLSKPAVKDITLNYKVTDINSTVNEDYILDNPLTILIPKNATSSSIIIKVKGDTDIEDNESLSLKLIYATNAIVDSKSVIGTIIDDDNINPIGCLQTAWMFQDSTDINALNLTNGNMVSIIEGISNDNINAVGFNKKDGYFWGYNHTKKDGTIAKVGMSNSGNWIAEYFKINGLNGFDSYVGDIDSNGKLYLKGSGSSKRVVVIDLDKNSSTYLQKIRDFNLNKNLSTADWAFNAKDNMLYAVNNGNNTILKKLYQINPLTGAVTVKGDTFLTGNRSFGAGFFDADGFYYIYDNYSGNIYRIDVANSTEAILFSTASIVSLNDGAMCTDAKFKFDFGDLPSRYPTKLESNGARHSLPTYGNPSIYLGNGVSSESNGKPSESANLDELDDGVKINNSFLQNKTINAGESSSLKIKTHGNGFLNAWIDWNGDGDFNDDGEQIANNINGSNNGEIILTINPPATAIDIVTYARFRYSYQKDLLPTGSAIDGEVEDYKITIHGNLEPFVCSNIMYLSNRTANGLDEDNSGATWLHRFAFPNFIYTPIGDGFISSDYGYNAIGYNIQDNFIYALYLKRLLKIDRHGNIKDLGEVSGIPESQLYAGEFDKDGYYYVAGVDNPDNRLYKIDIAQKKVIQTLNLKYSQRRQNESVKFLDMAIDSSNHYFYAMLLKSKNGTYENSKFVKIDKNSGVITILGDEFKDMNSYSNLIFSDKSGKIITITKNGNTYELDPSTGKDYLIMESSNAIGDYNDGTSCPNGEFILPPHLPRLSIGDVTMAEGDSGETKFRFKVSIDASLPMIPMGMPAMFYYRVIDGNGNDITPPHGVALQSDNDFKGSEGIGFNMNIFLNKREMYIEVPVYGDTKVEKDEEFYVEIYFPQMFPTNFCLMGKSRGVGLILNDDLKFNIIRTNANIDDKTIYTQIAGRDFDYSIVSLKGNTPATLNNLTVKVKLIDNINNKTLYEGYKYIDGDNRIDVVDDSDLKILDVTKDASFKVYFIKDSNGSILHGNYANRDSYNAILNQTGYSEINQDASESFTIRPAGYRVYIKDIDESNKTITYRDSSYSGGDSLKLSAGYNYMIEADAVALDSNFSNTKGYTTIANEINTTLKFRDKSTCRDKSNIPLSNYKFNNSHLIDNLSHSNVGEYQLHIEDSSWSSADGTKGGCILGSSTISTDGNNKSGCNISSTTITNYRDINLKFYPYRFNITNINLVNRPNNGRDYIYMNDLNSSLDMGLLLSANIVAEDKSGNQTTNFTSSCEAFDTSLHLNYHITTDRIDNQPTYDKIYTIKGSEVGFKRAVSYNKENFNSIEDIHLDNNISISADKFLDKNDGNTSINILLNLNKNLSEPINPVKLDFNSIDINSTDSSKVKNRDKVADGSKDIGSSKLFYFASIAPDRENYEDVYQGHCKTPISALIFCDKNISWCSSMIGNNGLNGIRTKYGWYRAYLHNSDTDGKVINFIVSNPLVVVTPTANHLSNFNNGKIEDIVTGYSGDHLPAKVEVKIDLTPWLKYHREPSRNGIPFWRNTFRDKNATLSGVGLTGQVLETSTTTKVAKKIEW